MSELRMTEIIQGRIKELEEKIVFLETEREIRSGSIQMNLAKIIASVRRIHADNLELLKALTDTRH